jgi:predicted amidophosphoribosyltransferase
MSDSQEALKRFAQAALALQEAWAKEGDGALDNGYPFAKDFADVVLEIQEWSEKNATACEYCGARLTDLGAHGIGCPKCAEAEDKAVELLFANATRFALYDNGQRLGLCPSCGACLTEMGSYCGECVATQAKLAQWRALRAEIHALLSARSGGQKLRTRA